MVGIIGRVGPDGVRRKISATKLEKLKKEAKTLQKEIRVATEEVCGLRLVHWRSCNNADSVPF